MKRSVLLDWMIPLGILAGFTVVFWTTDLDLSLQRIFFDPTQGWIYRHVQPWQFLYQFGAIPSIALAGVSLAAYIWSFWNRKIAPYRKMLLFCVVLLALGPGLVVNTIFKDHWGRPRPRNIQEFGGNAQFLKVWEKGVGEKNASFPSGHASMGFYLFAPFFFMRQRSKRWALFWLVLGLSAGTIIGLARILQGAHFLSDVIWAGGFVYLCGLGLTYLFRL
jgi:lipid A 4'-phosphatase